MPVSNRGLVVVSGIFRRASMPDQFVQVCSGWPPDGASPTYALAIWSLRELFAAPTPALPHGGGSISAVFPLLFSTLLCRETDFSKFQIVSMAILVKFCAAVCWHSKHRVRLGAPYSRNAG